MATTTDHCIICASEPVQLRISPQDHERPHSDDERACGQCWEAWLSLQVEEKKPEEIECLFCKSIISEADFAKLARKATGTRYSVKKLLKGVTCMARCKGSLKGTQAYDRERDGRVFTCQHCSFRVCTDCDRPEHTSETCDEYRKRQEVIHGQAEALFLNTLTAFKICPDCNAAIEPLKSACHTQCTSCGFQFCSGCMMPWVGEGSAYLLGKEAHTERCKYRTRDAKSTHSLGNRWEQMKAVKERLSAKAERKAERDENRKRARAEAAFGESTGGSESERLAMKSKMAKRNVEKSEAATEVTFAAQTSVKKPSAMEIGLRDCEQAGKQWVNFFFVIEEVFPPNGRHSEAQLHHAYRYLRRVVQ